MTPGQVRRDYETLDAIVVVATLGIIAGSLWALIHVNIPSDQLPIVASIVGTLVGTIVGGYAGFRWGSNQADKRASETTADVARTTMGALAQIAGAGPPPPSSPMEPPLEGDQPKA